MRICYKGYGVNKRLVLCYNKPNLKIKVNANNYYRTTTFLRNLFSFLDKNKFVLLSLFWMFVIFMFSGQTAQTSASLSDSLNNKFAAIPVLNVLFKIIPIRKFAHFILYFCLSIFVSFALCDYEQENIYIKSIFICFLYACSDEFHQLFINGRSGMFSDVLIDTLGASTSLLFIYLGCMVFYKLSNLKRYK